MKRLISILLSVVLLLSLCSCLHKPSASDLRNRHYIEIKKYLNENTSVKVVDIKDGEYNEDIKSVSINVFLPFKATASLKQMDELRTEISKYLQQDGEYLAEGWQVAITVVDDARSTGEGTRYAEFANFVKGYLTHSNYERYETSDYLNSFRFYKFKEEDTSYISSLDDVEHMYISGGYSENDAEWLDRTIEQIKSLDNLKTLRINTSWYEAFASADLGCEIIEYNHRY